jgi:putative DNA primase/helicase
VAYALLKALAVRTPPESRIANPESRTRPATRPSRQATSPVDRAIAYAKSIDPAIAGQRGHNQTLRAACSIGPGFDLDPEDCLRILLEHFNPRCEPPWSEKELRHKVEEAYRLTADRGWLLNEKPKRERPIRNLESGISNPEPPTGRPEIELTTERHQVLAQALSALTDDPDLFHRGDSLGVIVTEPAPRAQLPLGVDLDHAQGSSRFLPISEANLSCHLTRSAFFYRMKTGQDGEPQLIDQHPPDWLTKAIATHGTWPGIRPLLTLTDCPFVRGDGTLPIPGYDRATGTLYRPAGKVPDVPTRPTQKDAQKAAQRLYEVLHQFPFESGFDWSVWIAALLTAIQRPLIAGPVPGFVANGNKAGIGKGLLIDAVGILVWGHSIPTRSYPTDPIEAAKVKLSLGLAGVPAVHFDNLPEGGLYGNGELDSAITSTEVLGRLLGQSRESGAVPLRPCWFLSGNNVAPSRDAYRRWLPCNLVTPLESPHERADIQETDLRSHIHQQRPGLLAHALTLLRAHARAGRPTEAGKGALGSFEEWDRIVRGAVYFATAADCLTTQRRAYQEGPERADKLALLEGWAELPEGGQDGSGLTVEEAIAHVQDRPEVFHKLHSALLRMGKEGKMPNTARVGYKIRSLNRQNIGGMRFEQCGEKDHSRAWRVVKA